MQEVTTASSRHYLVRTLFGIEYRRSPELFQSLLPRCSTACFYRKRLKTISSIIPSPIAMVPAQ